MTTTNINNNADIIGINSDFSQAISFADARLASEEWTTSDADFLRDVIRFVGGRDLALCHVRGGGHEPRFQVAGPSRGLVRMLKADQPTNVSTCLPVVWICPVSGSAFPINDLAHLLDLVARFAELHSVRKAGAV